MASRTTSVVWRPPVEDPDPTEMSETIAAVRPSRRWRSTRDPVHSSRATSAAYGGRTRKMCFALTENQAEFRATAAPMAANRPPPVPSTPSAPSRKRRRPLAGPPPCELPVSRTRSRVQSAVTTMLALTKTPLSSSGTCRESARS